jgi:TolB-like protein/tetratricopeptide (TPR) repeat protein
MPFDNQGAAEDQYLADGISDEVRGKLTSVSALSVIASTSTDPYRDSKKSPEAIARELGADYILIGKVRWATGDDGKRRIQVTPELINGKTGAVSWQQPFDADVADVFSVQTTIATRVADALGAVLGVTEKQDLEARPTANAAAYELYLKGRAIRSNAAADQRRAAGFFEQAVALDSTFQDAWAWLSFALARVYGNGTRDPAVGRRTKETADIAVRLDSTKAIGHQAMASYYRTVEPDANKAYLEVQSALRASPNDAGILASSAGLLRQMGRLQEALTVAQRARDLDPRSINTLFTLQAILTLMHRGPEAQQVGVQLIALDPTNPTQVQANATAWLLDGKLDQAKATVEAALDTIPEPDLVAYFAGYNEMSWLLTEPQQQLLFRLTPAAFDNDRAWWGQSLGTAAWVRGDRTRARAYADSGFAAATEQLNANPTDLSLQVLRGVMLAYMGRKAEAVAAADKVLAAIGPSDLGHYYEMQQAVRIFLAVGETDRALDNIETLLKAQYQLTPAWLKVDPMFAPLKGNPRFERLIASNTAN